MEQGGPCGDPQGARGSGNIVEGVGIGSVVPCIAAYHQDFPPVCLGLEVAGNDRRCSEGEGGQGPGGTSPGVGAGNLPCVNMNHPE